MLEVEKAKKSEDTKVLDIPGLWPVHLHYTKRLPEHGEGLGDKQDLPEARS